MSVSGLNDKRASSKRLSWLDLRNSYYIEEVECGISNDYLKCDGNQEIVVVPGNQKLMERLWESNNKK